MLYPILPFYKGARVVLNAGVGDAAWLTNATARREWVRSLAPSLDALSTVFSTASPVASPTAAHAAHVA